ncbi:MAG: outer membrane receptor for ferrienterochelin and colicins, partial [Saprospiraceae bacterium]
YANVIIAGTDLGAISDINGNYSIEKIPVGTYEIEVSMIGYTKSQKSISVPENDQLVLDFDIIPSFSLLNQIVVTGTKTFKRRTNSPVMVNIVSNKTLNDVQACNLSEGLKFQPGLRVETDCQTCNYTQLRMNGLAGGYSQILINGRPIFSPLTGLYGLEQLPVNMIDRIEVVRGGGSSLYGSSAIGGTVNVLTKIPEKNAFELNFFHQNINGQSSDNNLSGNASVVADDKNSGISFFINHRNREHYDHNEDNFSEIPEIRNTSFGTNFFALPRKNQKLEISLSNLNEYRFGGEITDKPAYLTLQSEERTHNVWLGSADYQINFNEDKTSFISYMAWQNTKRKHYTGIFPDDSVAIQHHLLNAPYGTSNTTTLQGGLQVNHRLSNFLGGSNVFTLGGEYVVDDVFDKIDAYNYKIDQVTKNLGFFVQSDWEIFPSLNLLSGFRLDKHNLVDGVIISPRASLLYKVKNTTQFRLSYGTGFRAPQAFDADLHIAFAGGGVSRIQLSPDLEQETSRSISASINYDKPTENFIAGFTLEAFHTYLKDAFFQSPIGADNFGEVFEKRNGSGATVQGLTLELRGNFKQKIQLETGFTIQTSEYDDPVEYITEIPPTKDFLRTPNEYGFATLSIMPNKRFNANLNYIYTGSMKLAHFAGAPNQLTDEIINSQSFNEVNVKAGYTFPFNSIHSNLEFYGGIKNIFNAYQEDFDIGKNRDSNHVYGPGLPRVFFVGFKVMSK